MLLRLYWWGTGSEMLAVYHLFGVETTRVETSNGHLIKPLKMLLFRADEHLGEVYHSVTSEYMKILDEALKFFFFSAGEKRGIPKHEDAIL